MTPDDLAAIHAAAFGAAAWSAAEFETFLQHPGAILSANPQGFALLRVVLDEAEVLALATHPAHRRSGVACGHMLAAEKAAQKAGATRVFLEVAADNMPARALYAALGYTQVGKRRGYYRRVDQPAADALILQKSLPAA